MSVAAYFLFCCLGVASLASVLVPDGYQCVYLFIVVRIRIEMTFSLDL